MSGPDEDPWYDEGTRLTTELDELSQRGYRPERQTVEKGRLRLDAHVRQGTRDVAVEIDFAAGHPFIAPTVRTRTGLLERHQMPSGENFCLDRDDAPWWRPWNTAADLLDHLQSLLDADLAGEVREREADMAEPITGLVAYTPGVAVVVASALCAEKLDADAGVLQLVRGRRNPQLLLTESLLDGDEATRLLEVPAERRLVLRGAVHRFRALWRAVELPGGRKGVELAMKELGDTLSAAVAGALRGPKHKVQVRTVWAAITFMQEGPRRGESTRAWLFARQRVPIRGRRYVPPPALIPSQALDPRMRRLRTRELSGLEHARFLVVGAGALGGHAALELARAGAGALDVADHDRYDLNNGVRHVLPASYAGRQKASAVAEFARASSPFTVANGHELNVGATPEAQRRLAALIAAATVVIDTTGNENVTRLLHWRCSALGVPLVSGALSAGGLGGRIVVLRDPSPCLDCFYENLSIPKLDSTRISGTTPYGCSHPAASCAPFEVVELAANVARTAARCVPRIPYPALDFDWAVINFRRDAPRWSQGLLSPLRDCVGCAGDPDTLAE
jgi:molybdopterin/thiamine biosynthesis adenylyltransferase